MVPHAPHPPHVATAAARPAACESFATAAATAAALDHLRPWLPAIAGVWLAGALVAAGRADELPKDTNQIERLTVEQA